ncbi:MAG: hypothetical protein LBV50_07420, partial [Novosphingobium sp.]|nr:hypothetical protein [Novosphingobium sp.]
MPRAEKIDLSTLDILSIDAPATGERLLYDTGATGLALRLRAGGSRTWVLLSREHGKTVRRTLGEAAALPLDTARRMAAVPLPSPLPAPSAPLYAADIRVAELMPAFLAVGEKGRWKARTVATMRSVAKLHILPRLGERKVRDITPEEVTRWHLDVKAVSAAERMALSTLSGLMLYAEDHGLREIGSNPCARLRKKQRGHRGQLLPAAAAKRLWAALDKLQGRMPDVCDVVRL